MFLSFPWETGPPAKYRLTPRTIATMKYISIDMNLGVKKRQGCFESRVHPDTLSLESAYSCEINVSKPLYFPILLIFLENLSINCVKMPPFASFINYQAGSIKHRILETSRIIHYMSW